MPPSYRHTQSQPGLVWFYAAVTWTVLLLLILIAEANAANAGLILPPLTIFCLVVALLSRLTVEVTEEELRLEFGLGFGRVRFPRAGRLAVPHHGRRRPGDRALADSRRILTGTDDLKGLRRALC